jgi:RluA family pseudouridine synthase
MSTGSGGPLPGVFTHSQLSVEPVYQGLRADVFLTLALPFLSRTRIRQKIQTGESLLNGRRYATSARLSAGDVLTILWSSAPTFSPARQFEILFQDEYIIAVDKPAGVASHPTGRFQADTVIQFVRERFTDEMRASLSQAGDFFPCLVNRLDVFTSGVVIAAKTRSALHEMQGLASSGKIRKRYLALVEGVVAQEECTIDLPLGPDPASSIALRMAPRPDGLESVTDCAVLRRLKAHTLLAVYPRTGRQHQIRAHLAAIGHPIWGDLLYKDESLFLKYQRAGGALDSSLPPRHCLHAEKSEFRHPFTGEHIIIRSALHSDFQIILKSFENQPAASQLS